MFISCKHSSNDWKGDIRIELISSEGGNVSISVHIEGETGNLINGAFVSIANSDKTNTILQFNNERNCYYGLLGNSKNDKYIVTIKSVLFGERQFEIPHCILREPPVLETFCDSTGNSYFLGNSLDSQNCIRLSWNSSVDDCIYKIIIKNSADIIYESTTNNTTLMLPEKSLSNTSNLYYLKIQQQKVFGDLMFEKEKYYSVSIISSDNYIFSLY